MATADNAGGSEVARVTEQLEGTQLDNDEHWDDYWDAAFSGVRGYAFQPHLSEGRVLSNRSTGFLEACVARRPNRQVQASSACV